jgi:RNA polymerase sigma factor (sigma-70 family)
VLAAVGAEDPEVRRRALDTLVRSYWRPVYKYLRLRWRLPEEDARDLTQDFFFTLLKRELVERYDRERARFRTWLRTCLDGLVANERRAAGREKRGGGAPHVPLDFETAEGELRRHEVPVQADPDEIFRREWIRGLFGRAVERLRDECEGSGREVRWRLFARYDLEAPEREERLTYADLAREAGVEVTKVTNELHAARRRLRTLVLGELREITGSEEEFREEARELFGGDAP